ncbi:MAG: phosphoenolpyruvate--protein phosphotransferase, partial [Nitriliruptorales bacterium]|nr:phosphoenolpyruvate--protein phosphotransferase [Nitriliruptorales bacterium]
DSGAAASGRSILGLVGLAADGGTEVAVSAGGPDAGHAAAAVMRLITDGFGEMEEGPATAAGPARASRDGAQPATPEGALAGQPGAPGVGVGPLARLQLQPIAVPDEPGGDAGQERGRLAEARREVAATLKRGRSPGAAADPQAGILAAHLELLEDPELDAGIEPGLTAGRSAARAWSDAIEVQRKRLAALPGEVFAQRATDVADVGRQVLAALLGVRQQPQVAAGAIVAADDVVPSLVPALRDARAAGLALGGSSATSHAAVLARGLGLPLVVGLGAALDTVAEGTPALLDGGRGLLLLDPAEEVVRAAQRAQREARAAHEQARAEAAAPAVTPDGTAITVAANVASLAEARAAVEEGADEVGLLRTELTFLDREGLPGEDEQVEALTGILETLHPRPVIVRTLDVGGDKPAPALGLDPVRNGFLGQRGLRLSLAWPELFHTQLRAILRAARGHRVRLMFPLVSTVTEVRGAKRRLAEARASLEADGLGFGEIEQVGIMVEVPAAALAADHLAPEADFFSIGSNDLLQYVMAADRTLAEVSALRDPRHPALLRLVAMTCRAAAATGRWVGVCGEIAGDRELARLLIGLGVTELSMAPRSIPAVKAMIRATTRATAEAFAAAAVAPPELRRRPNREPAHE